MTSPQQTSQGCLILLSTPIGNLDDLSVRAKMALATKRYVVAEDTRVYSELMRHLGLGTEGVQIHAFHDHNQDNLARPLQWLEQGHDVLVVSDAGSPIVSDPAYPLVRAALAQGVRLESYPGASAPLVALELSGLPPHPFSFHGFLPRESGKRKTFLQQCLSQPGTHIAFEAPHRILETLHELCALAAPETSIVVARELTKKFETLYRFQAKQWSQWRDQITVKGEFVLLFHVDKGSAVSADRGELKKLAQKYLEKPSTKSLAKLLALVLESDTREMYQQLSSRD